MPYTNILDADDKVLATVRLDSDGRAYVSYGKPDWAWLISPDLNVPGPNGTYVRASDGAEYLKQLPILFHGSQGGHALYVDDSANSAQGRIAAVKNRTQE